MISNIKKLKSPLIALTLLANIGIPTLAHAVAGDILPQSTNILNTSPLYAENLQSYHSCNVANITTAPVRIKIELIGQSGAILQTTGSTGITLAAGQIYQLGNSATYSGYARCRFSNAHPDNIRANMLVFRYTGSYFETLAVSEAR